MAEGYDCMGNSDCSHSWFDELLCEYVDGTMDPAVRSVFEEYLQTNPVLARQVERLRCTRKLLCRHGCHARGTQGVQDRIRRRLAREMACSESPFFPEAASQLGLFVAVGSVMAAMVMVGLLVGAVFTAGQETPLAEQDPLMPSIVWQDMNGNLQSMAMTPLSGHRPHSLPAFARQSTSFPLQQPAYRYPEVFPMEPLQTAGLQRTSVVP